MKISEFTKRIWSFYAEHGRQFPWRETSNPYHILVSEIMLQQTQAPRVVPKYESWIKRFPTPQSVAGASIQEILGEWKGLGYNRRALSLKRACEIIVNEHKGRVPRDREHLIALPGVGPYTACAIRTFAWNEPEVFIETNIRSVFIHFFCSDRASVHDRDLLPLIEKTLDRSNSREWYWALMDYGAHLKQTEGNPSQKSAHYSRQSSFRGSNREERSFILDTIRTLGKVTKRTIELKAKDKRLKLKGLDKNLVDLEREGFIKKINRSYSLQ